MSQSAYRPPIVYRNVSELHILLPDIFYINSTGKLSITYCLLIDQPAAIIHCLRTNQPASITHCLRTNQTASITHCLGTYQTASITCCRPIDQPENIISNPTSFSITN
jgi:hypothetical protein